MGEDQRQGRVVPESDRKVPFCCKCFADERGGSWGEGTVQGHCYNCGSGGTTAWLPIWAVDMIRENASWVGRRYYPNDEDRANAEERRDLLDTIKEFPGRTVETQDGPLGPVTIVQQALPNRTKTLITFRPEEASEKEAWEQARYALRYVPKEKLP